MCYPCEQQLQYCMVLSKPGSSEERKELGAGEGGGEDSMSVLVWCVRVWVCVGVGVCEGGGRCGGVRACVCCVCVDIWIQLLLLCTLLVTCFPCVQPSDAYPRFYNVRPPPDWEGGREAQTWC